MVKKVIKIGSSVGVTLSKDLLKKLAVEQGSIVEINYISRRKSVEIRKPRVKDENSILLKKVAEISDKYCEELKKLNDEW